MFYINVVCLLATFDPSPGAKSKQFFAAALCDRVSPITIPNISQNAWEFNRARMYIVHNIYKTIYIYIKYTTYCDKPIACNSERNLHHKKMHDKFSKNKT